MYFLVTAHGILVILLAALDETGPLERFLALLGSDDPHDDDCDAAGDANDGPNGPLGKDINWLSRFTVDPNFVFIAFAPGV